MGDMLTDLVDTLGPEIRDSLEVGGDDALTHGVGSVLHSASTLADLNTKVSDATLDANTASRPASSAAPSVISWVPLEIAQDGAVAILDTTNAIYLADSTVGTKVIATTSSYPGQVIPIRLVLNSGGSYTLVVSEGTLTFDAAGESAVVVRNIADDAWNVLDLNGATIV